MAYGIEKALLLEAAEGLVREAAKAQGLDFAEAGDYVRAALGSTAVRREVLKEVQFTTKLNRMAGERAAAGT